MEESKPWALNRLRATSDSPCCGGCSLSGAEEASPPPAEARPQQLRDRSGDAARIEVALPRDPHDPYLQDWVRVQPGPAKFGKAQMLS